MSIKEYPDITLISCKNKQDKLDCKLRKGGEVVGTELIDRIGASVGVNVNVGVITPESAELHVRVMDESTGEKYTCMVSEWRNQRVLSCHLDKVWEEYPPKTFQKRMTVMNAMEEERRITDLLEGDD